MTFSPDGTQQSSPEVDALVREIIERVADKWTMLLLEALEEHGTVRFTRLGALVSGVSQKMLTKTLRQMESDGLVVRTIHPVIPPHVDYRLTELGHTLSAAFCSVWQWAEKNYDAVQTARRSFAQRGFQIETPPNKTGDRVQLPNNP
jgi:DNA-binding HxlR family transcriptional regulator